MSPDRARKVLTLLVEMRCNSYCVFCGLRQIDDGLVRARARVGLSTPETAFGALRGRYTLESAIADLRKAKDEGFTEVSLQGGEPTIWPDIVALVGEARRMGFEFIGIVTNGRKLADPEFATALVGAGLDGVTASLVGWNAETHDGTALVQGAFDELMAGLKNASRAAAALARNVTINVNVITSARTVDHLAEQVQLLAGAGVRAAVVHLVRYSAMGSDPIVRDALRFDIRRVTPALARGKAAAARAGISLHASDVPMCLHPELDPSELAVLRHRAAVDQHQYQGASFGFDGMPHLKESASRACDGCLLASACPRVPREYLPPDPADALRPITAVTLGATIDETLAGVDPAHAHAGRRVGDLARSIQTLRAMAPEAPGLDALSARLDEALLDLTRAAYERGQPAAMSDAFWSYLGLKPPQWDLGDLALAAPRWPVATLAHRTGAVPPDRAGAGPRLRFAPSFEVALTGTLVGDRELELTAARPVLYPVGDAAAHLYRALFLACVCVPLRGAKRLRVSDDRIAVDSGEGYRTAFTVTRPGAVALS